MTPPLPDSVAKEIAALRVALSKGCPDCGYVIERPIKNCGKVGEDGCCEHPDNLTPECHQNACPIVANIAALKDAVIQAVEKSIHDFEELKEKQDNLLIYGQTLESAAANWDEATLVIFDFKSMIDALAALKRAQ